jgi:hypothetical protein
LPFFNYLTYRTLNDLDYKLLLIHKRQSSSHDERKLRIKRSEKNVQHKNFLIKINLALIKECLFIERGKNGAQREVKIINKFIP